MAKLIRVSDETHKKLTKMGFKNQSYDDIVSTLVDHWEITGGHHG